MKMVKPQQFMLIFRFSPLSWVFSAGKYNYNIFLTVGRA